MLIASFVNNLQCHGFVCYSFLSVKCVKDTRGKMHQSLVSASSSFYLTFSGVLFTRER